MSFTSKFRNVFTVFINGISWKSSTALMQVSFMRYKTILNENLVNDSYKSFLDGELLIHNFHCGVCSNICWQQLMIIACDITIIFRQRSLYKENNFELMRWAHI